jgi:hypothetical protein
VGGVTAGTFLDTGAIDCVMSIEFVKQQGFHVKPSCSELELADCKVVPAAGTVQATFRLQQYSRDLTFECMKLAP